MFEKLERLNLIAAKVLVAFVVVVIHPLAGATESQCRGPYIGLQMKSCLHRSPERPLYIEKESLACPGNEFSECFYPFPAYIDLSTVVTFGDDLYQRNSDSGACPIIGRKLSSRDGDFLRLAHMHREYVSDRIPSIVKNNI